MKKTTRLKPFMTAAYLAKLKAGTTPAENCNLSEKRLMP